MNDIQYVSIADLMPDEANANLGSERGEYMIAESLQQFGAGRSILVDKNGRIIAGNKTAQKAGELGIEDVLVIETDGTKLVAVKRTDLDLTDGDAARKLAYMDNRASEVSLDWDVEQIASDLDAGLDLSDMWFDDELAEKIERFVVDEELPPAPDAQMDKAAELQEKWQVADGDVWQCGDHFIICGDCREPDTWTRLLAAAGVDRVNGVFTSPPYAEQRKKQYGGVPTDEYVEWWEVVQDNVRAHLNDDGSFFVNIKPHCENGERVLYVFDLVLAMKRRWGWRFVDELCWLCNSTPGKWPNRFKNGFEPIYQFSLGNNTKFVPQNVSEWGETFKADGKTHYDGGNAIHGAIKFDGWVLPANIIRTTAQDSKEYRPPHIRHEASFPVALPDFFIRAYSDPDDVWLDPFVGSGTTIVAAHQNERRGLGIEKLEKYCSVTLERLAGLGLQPRLMSE